MNRQRFFHLMILMAVLLLLPLQAPAATTAKDVTKQCKILMPGGLTNRELITDRKYKTVWVSEAKKLSLRIELPKKTKQGGLYICWGDRPESWTLYQGENIIASNNDKGYAHEYVPFPSGESLRLEIAGQKTRKGHRFTIGELFVFSGETPPKWVQQWEDPLPQADLLVLVAHPDDELLFMGGAIPYYAIQQRKNVVVSYLTCANSMRRSEMLNGLWAMGIRNYPVIGSFPDKAKKNKEAVYQLWGKERAQQHVVSLLRQYRPQVVISHDIEGEYGHAAHKACADLIQYAVKAAAQPTVDRKSLDAFGAWQVSKLYLHLYPENKIKMDWEQPLSAFGGKTALDVTKIGYAQHRSQRGRHQIGMNDKYDSSLFGLAFTTVGQDVQKNDFFENVIPR